MSPEREVSLSRKQYEIMKLLIEHGEQYGQELVSRSDGALSRGTIYVTLSRMEEKGFVTSRKEDRAPGAIGLPRVLYKMTGLGKGVTEAFEMSREHVAGLLGSA